MSLKVWLPLLGNLKNQGTGNYTEQAIASGNSWASEGKIGDSSLKLTKIQTVLPASSTLSCMAGAKQMSWCFWVKINNVWTTSWLDGIRWYSTNGTQTHASRMEFYTNCTKIGTWYQDGSISGKNITPGVWTHLAATYDYNTGKVSFYINGILQETKNTLNTSHYCRGDFYIGDSGVDILENDVRIYDHCLSAAEVHEISQGLILHYKLDNNGMGNKNLALNSRTFENWTIGNGWQKITENNDIIYHYERTGGTSPSWNRLIPPLQLNPEDYLNGITISFDFKCTDVSAIDHLCLSALQVYRADGVRVGWREPAWDLSLVENNKWIRLFRHFTYSELKTNNSSSYPNAEIAYTTISFQLCKNGSIYIKNVKIENGSKATPYFIAPEDLGIDTTIVEDSSGYGHNGTINSTISYENSQGGRYSTQAYIGNETTQSVDTPNMLFENMLQGTLNIWINRKSTNANWRLYTFFANAYNWTGNSHDFLIIGSTGDQRIILDCCSNTYSGFTPDLNKWYMYTISWDLTTHTAKMYVNGELKSTKVNDRIDTTYASKHNLHYFGNRYLNNSTYTGDYLLSDARIYCTQLLDNDIKMLYNVGMKVDNLQNLHTFNYVENEDSGTKTLTGNIITVEDAASKQLENLVININSTQSGSGTPSPDNVRPIAGWTGAKVTRCGKNLLQYWRSGYFDTSGRIISNSIDKMCKPIFLPSGESLTVKLNNNLSGSSRTRGRGIVAFADEGLTMLLYRSTSEPAYIEPYTYTASQDCYVVMWLNYDGANYGETVFDTLQVQAEPGSVATDYEPYSGETYSIAFPAEAGTVYGGTLDVTTGTLTVDRGMVDLGTLNWKVEAAGGAHPNWNNFYAAVPNAKGNFATYGTTQICSHYANQTAATWNDKTCRFGYSSTNINISDSALSGYTAAQFKTAMSGVQLAYELATPVTYQLGSSSITLLTGENNIFADTGNISLEYSYYLPKSQKLTKTGQLIANNFNENKKTSLYKSGFVEANNLIEI